MCWSVLLSNTSFPVLPVSFIALTKILCLILYYSTWYFGTILKISLVRCTPSSFLVCCLFLNISSYYDSLLLKWFPLDYTAIWGKCLQFLQLQFSHGFGIFLMLQKLQINHITVCLFICQSTAVRAFLARAAQGHSLSWGCFTVFAFFGWAVSLLTTGWMIFTGGEVACRGVTQAPLVNSVLMPVMAFSCETTLTKYFAGERESERSILTADRWSEHQQRWTVQRSEILRVSVKLSKTRALIIIIAEMQGLCPTQTRRESEILTVLRRSYSMELDAPKYFYGIELVLWHVVLHPGDGAWNEVRWDPFPGNEWSCCASCAKALCCWRWW